jgi:hypothetical protein
MYPAEFLDSGYLFEDLPDQVEKDLFEGPTVFSKVAEPYVISLLTESYEVYYEGPTRDGILEFIAIPDGDKSDWYSGSILEGDRGPCLVSDVGGGAASRDSFADTYIVSWASGDIPTTTVTRVALCQWRSEVITIPSINQPYIAELFYEGFIFAPPFANTPDRLFWSIEGARKNGAQNTPVGTYTIGDDTATVTE